MSHYFLNDQTLKNQEKSYKINLFGLDFIFFTDSGVFSKDYLDFGSKLLIKNIELNNQTKTVIDMGCGYGPIGLYVAKKYPSIHVSMFDINERAVALTQKNILENKVNNAVAHVSNLFDGINVFADVIFTNPPIRAGKEVVFKLYLESYQHLNSGGSFYVVINKKQGAPSSLEKIKEIFGNCEMIDRDKGYWILFAQKD
jgi:16S rRNA (guanine1207-N2)-methyltransferase